MKSNPLPTNQPANRTKMFCKVCKDAKKSESVYTSHSVRVGGKVVCPTLLSQECKYCKEKGHTPKYCPKSKGKYNSTISSVKIRFGTTPTASEDAERLFHQRARELCSSPPPAPIGKKTNYFQLLNVDEETDEETSVIASLKPDYLAIAKSGVEKANGEWKKTKEKQIQNYKEDLEKNFPTLSDGKTSSTATNSKKPTTTKAVKSYLQVARTYLYDEYGNPLPRHSGYEEICHGCGQVCLAFCDNDWCDGTTPTPTTIKDELILEKNKKEIEEMMKWEEERRMNANTSPPSTTNEKDAKCSKCIPGVYGCSKCYPDCPSPSTSPPPDCLGTPSLSPTPPPTTTTTTTWTSWADVE